MGHSHLYIGFALRHIMQRRKRTSGGLEMPHQMSNTAWILSNGEVLGMRELPMKRLGINHMIRDNKTTIRTIHLSFLWRTITPLRTRWAARLNASNRCLTFRIFGPLGRGPWKSSLLTQNLCECVAHVSGSNAICIGNTSSSLHRVRITRVRSSRNHAI